ncbi:collagenase-like PrtC family protease [Lachnotalea glycerini]|uniref:Collagenase-like PrtC family protease n=1 Tax=Lachnotalea glycerini TaxID=1763509 RepID=A0A318F256_9FIRM|nr:U32 family peptidase [Lachnotalea glycerini]PXV95938.1 collagenase-like PrtC family protease [Lachnotalea glycerini]
MKTMLTVPCQWNLESIKRIVGLRQSNGIHIGEMYGALSNGITPQGRSLAIAHNTTKENALQIKRILDEHNISFAYLINTPIEIESCRFLDEELEWIINEFKADSLTISSKELMQYIRKRYPDIRINVSTIAGIKTIEDVKSYLSISPAKIIAHHDLNRNFKDLRKVLDYVKNNNMQLELMVNESCLRRCPYREQHYNELGMGNDDRKFHEKCNLIKIQNPYQLLMANFIRPEDLYVYESLGVNLFKITGRSKPIAWMEEVVQTYLNREFKENLMRLLGIDPLLKAEDWIFISNNSLDGFLQHYSDCDNLQQEIKYCEDWIIKLYHNKQFYIDREMNCQEKNGRLIFEPVNGIY